MTIHSEEAKKIPGTYVKTRPSAAELSNKYIREWEQKRRELGEPAKQRAFPPTICFSRKTGVGALEVADILAGKLGYRVADREILEYIASEAKLSEKTVTYFDERYPGKLAELLAMAFGEKAFTRSDYARLLFSAVLSIAGLGPTIFVGRGTHLILPRERVLAVRLLSSRDYRIKRLASMLRITEKQVEARMDERDRDQRSFYVSVYGKRDASPYEFDLVINCDYIREAGMAAEIVEKAFREKFRGEIGSLSGEPQ